MNEDVNIYLKCLNEISPRSVVYEEREKHRKGLFTQFEYNFIHSFFFLFIIAKFCFIFL
jgi:hypothetical protein